MSKYARPESAPRSPSHSLRAKHISSDAVNQSLNDLGVDKYDVANIDQIVKGVPSKTRHIKENAFSTIVNIQDKWQRHKEKTNSMLREAKEKLLDEKNRNSKLQSEMVNKELENDKLKNDIGRLEAVCQELTSLRAQEQRAIRDKEEMAKELARLKSRLDEQTSVNGTQRNRIEALESEKAKSAHDNGALRRGFKKMEHKALTLEKELKETKVELEMFEEMLSAIPNNMNDNTMSSMSDFDLSPVKGVGAGYSRSYSPEKPNAAAAITGSIGCSVVYPKSQSTPMASKADYKSRLVQKDSATTALNRMALQHEDSQRICMELAEEAKRMKIKDRELSKLLNESS